MNKRFKNTKSQILKRLIYGVFNQAEQISQYNIKYYIFS